MTDDSQRPEHIINAARLRPRQEFNRLPELVARLSYGAKRIMDDTTKERSPYAVTLRLDATGAPGSGKTLAMEKIFRMFYDLGVLRRRVFRTSSEHALDIELDMEKLVTDLRGGICAPCGGWEVECIRLRRTLDGVLRENGKLQRQLRNDAADATAMAFQPVQPVQTATIERLRAEIKRLDELLAQRWQNILQMGASERRAIAELAEVTAERDELRRRQVTLEGLLEDASTAAEAHVKRERAIASARGLIQAALPFVFPRSGDAPERQSQTITARDHLIQAAHLLREEGPEVPAQAEVAMPS